MKAVWGIGLLGVLLVITMLGCLFVGGMPVPAAEVWSVLTGWGPQPDDSVRFVVLGSRLPGVLTAAASGAALAVAGLMLQTYFNNELADPSILGVNAGAGLGVAVVMLWLGGGVAFTSGLALTGMLAVMLAACLGSVVALGLLVVCSMWLRSRVQLLIVGVMIGYVASAGITLLGRMASAQHVQAYVMWGMGDLGAVTSERLPLLLVPAGLSLAALWLAKPLGALRLGVRHAAGVGLDVRRLDWQVLLLAGALSGSVTSLCGPLPFVGLVVPHLMRRALRTSDPRLLLPACLLGGAWLLTLVSGVCRLFPQALPVGAVLPIVGAPVVGAVLFSRKQPD